MDQKLSYPAGYVEFLARAEIAFKYFEAVTTFGHHFFGAQS